MTTPITILTGFLGAGKTTILNQIIEQNPGTKFGLIINEFGEEGIDGQLVQGDDEEIVELSNGCICCVVRKDLQDAAAKLVESGTVDYIIIETSGLAEPIPVAQTFEMDSLDGRVALDSIICLVDAENYKETMRQYEVGAVQIKAADIVLINKINPNSAPNVTEIKELIKQINPYAAIIENVGNDIDSKLLIETRKWNIDKLSNYSEEEKEADHEHQEDQHEHMHEEHNHDEHEHHHHEHFSVDEVVFTTNEPISADKINKWILEDFPANAVRAKGILRLEIFPGQHGLFLFQMVGATRMLVPFVPPRADFNREKSTMVVIGKHLDKEAIISSLYQTTVS